MAHQQPIRLALIGAGIFAREVHIRALQSLGQTFEIVAVYSRSLANAAALAGQLSGNVDTYADLPALLDREDIEAVDIILPLDVMPSVVEMALRAGKHVISEKPIAPDLATGRRLLAVYADRPPSQVWMVGENWRYEDVFEQAARIVQEGRIGRPLLCHWTIYNPINPDNQYYHTPWRRSGSFPGGFLLDVGVHHVAVLRKLVGEIVQVNAMTHQIRADLPPADTLAATLNFDNGALGVYLATYAVDGPWSPGLCLTGETGSLQVLRESLEVISDGVPQTLQATPNRGVETELAAFAAAIRQGQPHRNMPSQAWLDVAVIEAMLYSAKMGRQIATERIMGQ